MKQPNSNKAKKIKELEEKVELLGSLVTQNYSALNTVLAQLVEKGVIEIPGEEPKIEYGEE